ncbi:MAG: terminase small subunit [Paracoccaceae bacterium]
MAAKKATKSKSGAGKGKSDKLSPREALFCQEYLVDLNGKQAAIRAGYAPGSAEVQASRLLSRDKVQKEIARLQEARSKRTEITQDEVLRRLWDQATADVNALVQHRRCACRYCYGIDHAFQWTTERAYREALEIAVFEKVAGEGIREALLEQPELDPRLPTDAGGYGYDRRKPPHPDCPECNGLGIEDVHIADTRNLTGPAAVLYEGVKETRQGIEIKLADRGKALDLIGKHLGLFKERVELDASQELLEAARTLNASTTTLTPGAIDPARLGYVSGSEGGDE